MTAHKHAALMAKYAKDALETDKPWERWEFQWVGDPEWHDASVELAFSPSINYRRKRVPLCQVEGRDVFAGDRLWHEAANRWIVAKKMSGVYIDCQEGLAPPSLCVWSEPPRTKTVYQWAFRYLDAWLLTNRYAATAEEVAEYEPAGSDFRRLDYTALEVEV